MPSTSWRTRTAAMDLADKTTLCGTQQLHFVRVGDVIGREGGREADPRHASPSSEEEEGREKGLLFR